MTVTHISILNFRNLTEISVNPSPSMNIFWGDNGAGKTSLLEAIYYLSRGRSFRTHLNSRIIQKNQTNFTLRANVNRGDELVKLGLQRFSNGKSTIHLNQENQMSISTLASYLPIKLIQADSYRYFFDGPKLRRQHLDWGVFHVEPVFLTLWQQAQHILKQRNACLRMHPYEKQISFWDTQMANIGEKINQLRLSYVNQLLPIFNSLCLQILPKKKIDLFYKKGWPTGEALENSLHKNFIKDKELGYTSCGPHRADLQVYSEKKPATDMLSQGEQKLISYTISLAQCLLLRKLTDKTPIILIDDLASELDQNKSNAIFDIIKTLQAQVFMTNIARITSIREVPNHSVFHVERGEVKQTN